MELVCSRCKTPRVLGVTDEIESEFEQFKTCMRCRQKLKEYRKSHVDKRKQNKNNENFKNDDKVNVVIMSHFDEKLKAKLHTHQKYANFDLILKTIYLNSNNKDLKIDETFKIPEFTLPHFFIDDDSEVTKFSSNNINNNNNNNSSEVIDGEEYSKFTNLLLKQTEKDEKFKINLINSLNLHFINRVKHILTLCNYEYKFYSSSWKNGKYYINLKCYDDKNAMKRFGIDVDNLIKIKQEEKNNEDNDSPNEISLLKSKLNDWVKPTEKDSSKLSLHVNSNEVNLKLLKTPGFYCHSKLTLIADYSKLEIKFKFAHKYHRFELNENINDETGDSNEEGVDDINNVDDQTKRRKLDKLLERFKNDKNDKNEEVSNSTITIKKECSDLMQEEGNGNFEQTDQDSNGINDNANDNANNNADDNSAPVSIKLSKLKQILDL